MSIINKLKSSLETNDIFRHVFASRTDMTVLTDDDVKRLQKVLLTIMDDVHLVCEKYGLTYFLAGGSTLGAVRHKGFIPWDDDMDIILPRRDYDKLGKLLEREFPGKYYIQDSRFGTYDIHSMKIRLKGSVFKELFESEPERTGIFIDVYSAEDAYDGLRFKLHGYRCELLMLIVSCIKMKKNKGLILPYLTNENHIAIVNRKARLGAIFGIIPLKSWLRHTDKVLANKSNPRSEFIVVPSGRRHYFGETYSRASFFPAKKVPFEGREYYIMNEPDEYLTKLIGPDYMTPPDPGNLEHHAVMECEV